MQCNSNRHSWQNSRQLQILCKHTQSTSGISCKSHLAFLGRRSLKAYDDLWVLCRTSVCLISHAALQAKTMLRPVCYVLLHAQSIICTTAECTHSMRSSTDFGCQTAQGHTSGACLDANTNAKAGAWLITSNSALIHCH